MQQAYKTATILSAVMAVSLMGSAASASTITWTGTSSTDFEYTGNWSGTTTPPTDDLATDVGTILPGVSNMPILTKNRSVGGLSFGDGVSLNNGLMLGGEYVLKVGTAGIATNSNTTANSNVDTISAGVEVAANQTWTISRTSLHVSGVLSGSNNLTKSGASYLYLEGSAPANTYSGLLTVSNGRVYFNKSAGLAIAGDLSVGGSANSFALWKANNQLAATTNVTLSLGSLQLADDQTNKGISESFRDLTVSGGTINTDGGASSLTGTTDSLVQNQATTMTGGTINVRGGTQWTMNSLSMSGGIINRVGTNYGTSLAERNLTIGAGGLTITNTGSGVYAPIMIGNAPSGKATNKLVLQGDVTFTGTAGNANTAYISADTVNPTNPVKGTVELNGVRTFAIHDGDAAIDFRVTPAINNNGATEGGLTKLGAGTLELAGANLYTGDTSVNAGKLIVTGSIAGSKLVVGSAGTVIPGGDGNLVTMNVAGLDVVDISGSGGLVFDLGPSGTSDQINAAGAVTLGTLDFADFAFTSTGALGDGDTFTLLHGGSVAGSIGTASGALGGGFTGTLSQSGNDVILTVAVPEPATVGLLGLVVSLGLLRRERRKVA